MIKIFISIFVFIVNVYAIQTLTPTYSLQATSDVQDIVYNDNKLYAATSQGTIDIFDITTQKLIKKIQLPNIKDFMGDEIASKVYSVDILNNNILIVSQGIKGYRNLWIYKDDNLKKVIDINKKLFIRKARYSDASTIILATLSNQIMKFNLDKNKIEYTTQVSSSSFSDFVLDENKMKVITTDESGIVRILKAKSGKLEKEYDSKNLDRVYQLDYKNGVVLTAGQDRKAVVYTDFDTKSLDFNFLLYSCGLSPSAKLAAVAYNEQNDVLVFNVSTLDKLYNLLDNKATLTKILFIDENSLFTTSDNEQINFYKLKGE